MTPSAPTRSACLASSTATAVLVEPTCGATGTRPRACSVTISVTRFRSSVVSAGNSPVLPHGTKPCTPALTVPSTRSRRASSSTLVPSVVNGVHMADRMPRSSRAINPTPFSVVAEPNSRNESSSSLAQVSTCVITALMKASVRLSRGARKICDGGPSSTMHPPSIKSTRSATRLANPISWVTTTMVMPSTASRRMTSSTSWINSGSSAEVTSSNNMILGSIISARAMDARCFWPPDSFSGYCSALSLSPTFSSSASAFARASSGSVPRAFVGARIRFFITVICGNRLNCWNTIPIRLRRSRNALPRMAGLPDPAQLMNGWPSMKISPPFGSSKAMSTRRRVLLPDPDGPMTTTFSDVWISKLRSFRTSSGPKPLQRRRTAIIGPCCGAASATPPRPASVVVSALAVFVSLNCTASTLLSKRASQPELEPARKNGHRKGDQEVNGRDAGEDFDRSVGLRRDHASLVHQVADTQRGDQRRILEQADAEGEQDRDHHPKCLWNDDVAHLVKVREPQHIRRIDLVLAQGLRPPKDLDVRRHRFADFGIFGEAACRDEDPQDQPQRDDDGADLQGGQQALHQQGQIADRQAPVKVHWSPPRRHRFVNASQSGIL